jgi:hypothetical protein
MLNQGKEILHYISQNGKATFSPRLVNEGKCGRPCLERTRSCGFDGTRIYDFDDTVGLTSFVEGLFLNFFNNFFGNPVVGNLPKDNVLAIKMGGWNKLTKNVSGDKELTGYHSWLQRTVMKN